MITIEVTADGKLIADAFSTDVAERLPDIAADLSPADQDRLNQLATTIATARMPGGAG